MSLTWGHTSARQGSVRSPQAISCRCSAAKEGVRPLSRPSRTLSKSWPKMLRSDNPSFECGQSTSGNCVDRAARQCGHLPDSGLSGDCGSNRSNCSLCFLFNRLTSTASHRWRCSSIRQSVRAIGHVDRFGPTHFACAHWSPPPRPRRDHIGRRGRKMSRERNWPLAVSAIRCAARVGCIDCAK